MTLWMSISQNNDYETISSPIEGAGVKILVITHVNLDPEIEIFLLTSSSND